MPRTLLFIHPGSLGDVMLTLSAIRTVRAAFPRHACGLMAGGPVSRLLLVCGEVDRLYPLEQGGLAGLLAGPESTAPEIRSWLDKADIVVGWTKDSDGNLAATLRTLGARRVIMRSPFDTDCTSRHQADRYLETVASVVGGKPGEGPLQVPEAILKEGAGYLAGAGIGERQAFAVIHPGSGSQHKCCEPQLLAGLVAQMQAGGLVPILLAGPADAEQVRAVRQSCADPPLTFEGMDLISLAGLLTRAVLYVGQDSGVTHLAACLAVPTIALFGPTDPKRWAPRGSHVQVLSGAPCVCIDWSQVRACTGKPCLQVQPGRMIEACFNRLQERAERRSEARAAARCLVMSEGLC